MLRKKVKQSVSFFFLILFSSVINGAIDVNVWHPDLPNGTYIHFDTLKNPQFIVDGKSFAKAFKEEFTPSGKDIQPIIDGAAKVVEKIVEASTGAGVHGL